MSMPRIDLIKTGNNIYRYRKNAGLTVKDLQKLLGFNNSQAIYKWQRGEALPTVDNLVILARLFKVNIEEILVITDDG